MIFYHNWTGMIEKSLYTWVNIYINVLYYKIIA